MATLLDDKVEALLARARREIETGLLPSCQVALGLEGEVVVDETFGAPSAARYVIFSATKPVVAAAVWLLVQEGDLDVSVPVAELIPEFGSNGKDVVTVEQVMLHTAGFPHAPLGAPDWFTRESRLRRFGQWRLNWEPGSRYEYHPTSAHWVLAELIERITGVDYRTFVADQVIAPLGVPGLQVGVARECQDDIAPLEDRGEPPSPAELEEALGVSTLPVTEVTQSALLRFDEPEILALGVPGGGGVGSARDVARFYQALLHNTADLWRSDLLADVTSNMRNHFPEPIGGWPVERTLGLCTAGGDGMSHLRGFGRTVSSGAFGHNGAGGQLAWADPATGLSFCYLTNGLDQHTLRVGRRGVALSSLAAVCAA